MGVHAWCAPGAAPPPDACSPRAGCCAAEEGGARKAAAGGDEKLSHSLDILEAFTTLKLEVPLSKSKVPGVLEAVKAKKEHFLQRCVFCGGGWVCVHVFVWLGWGAGAGLGLARSGLGLLCAAPLAPSLVSGYVAAALVGSSSGLWCVG